MCSGNSSGSSSTGLKLGVTEFALTIMQSSSCSAYQVVCIEGSIVSSSNVLSVVSMLVSASAADAMPVVAFLLVVGLRHGVSENRGIPFSSMVTGFCPAGITALTDSNAGCPRIRSQLAKYATQNVLEST